MRSTILQNAKLLNGMHEGLLILSKLDKSILFVNRPAQKLLTSIITFIPKKSVAGPTQESVTMTKNVSASADNNNGAISHHKSQKSAELSSDKLHKDDPLLYQPVFHPVGLQVKDQVKQFREMVESDRKNPYNLD